MVSITDPCKVASCQINLHLGDGPHYRHLIDDLARVVVSYKVA